MATMYRTFLTGRCCHLFVNPECVLSAGILWCSENKWIAIEDTESDFWTPRHFIHNNLRQHKDIEVTTSSGRQFQLWTLWILVYLNLCSIKLVCDMLLFLRIGSDSWLLFSVLRDWNEAISESSGGSKYSETEADVEAILWNCIQCECYLD